MPYTKQQTFKKETKFAGLYIHVPFCSSKCPYCDFYSIASPSLIPRWIESLKKEILYYQNRFTCFDSIYLGGGTPSLLDVSTIKEILDLIKDKYNIIEDSEITIEANPGDLNQEKISGLKSLGINRINLGVQSFNDDDLLFLGRRHRSADSERVLNDLGNSGLDNIGIDLIYGLKDQSVGEWLKTLERALYFKPEHISCYQLTIEGKTVFNVMKNKGELMELPEELASSFFLETSDFLEQQGYIHYEVSNFARGLKFRSRHNCKYWQRIPYLGLGPSAHSFDGKRRWWNYRSVKKYCSSLDNNVAPVDDSETLSGDQQTLEKISLGLRTADGIRKEDLTGIPGAIKNIQKLEASGHLKIMNARVTPTKKGLLIADQLPLYIYNN